MYQNQGFFRVGILVWTVSKTYRPYQKIFFSPPLGGSQEVSIAWFSDLVKAMVPEQILQFSRRQSNPTCPARPDLDGQ